jgi:hypothetical protein
MKRRQSSKKVLSILGSLIGVVEDILGDLWARAADISLSMY